MPPSYQKIDYRLRPAKHAERVMLCETFRRLTFTHVDDYSYVGLGSVYFSDFALFHRTLGIKEMISIEREEDDEDRVAANRPFANIRLLFGPTSDHLPQLDLSAPTIAWLDYDDHFNRGMLDDAQTFAANCASGSMLLISANCMPPSGSGLTGRQVIDEVAQSLGKELVDPSYTNAALVGWGTAKIAREAITNAITATLASRNSLLSPEAQMQWEQVLFFTYDDGARMTTVGGVIFEARDRPKFDACGFSSLEFSSKASEPFYIPRPRLTGRELRRLDVQMPLQAGRELEIGSIPESDARAFTRIYRYFPNFVVVDLSW